jgi:hypothetical protein
MHVQNNVHTGLEEGSDMAVIEGLAFASAAGFAVIVVATIVVIIGVR